MLKKTHRLVVAAALAAVLLAVPVLAAESETPDGWHKEFEFGVNHEPYFWCLNN